MMRTILFLVGGLLLAWSASAQDAAPGPGRYQFAPDGDGFVRLDTETGAIAHCGRSESGWRCDGVAEDSRVVALQQELTMLKAELEDLSERLATIEQGESESAEAPPASRNGLSEQDEREFDEALSFAERMMQRFFDMIRELKDDEPPEQI
jgi:hypothetical protein